MSAPEKVALAERRAFGAATIRPERSPAKQLPPNPTVPPKLPPILTRNAPRPVESSLTALRFKFQSASIPTPPIVATSLRRASATDRWNEWRSGDLGWYSTVGSGVTSRFGSVPLWIRSVRIGGDQGVGSPLYGGQIGSQSNEARFCAQSGPKGEHRRGTAYSCDPHALKDEQDSRAGHIAVIAQD